MGVFDLEVWLSVDECLDSWRTVLLYSARHLSLLYSVRYKKGQMPPGWVEFPIARSARPFNRQLRACQDKSGENGF